MRDLLLVPALPLQAEGSEKVADRFSEKGEKHILECREFQIAKTNKQIKLFLCRALGLS